MIAVRVGSGCVVSRGKACPVSPCGVCSHLHSRQRARTICFSYAEQLLPAPRFRASNQSPAVNNYDIWRETDVAAVRADFENHTLTRNKGRLALEAQNLPKERWVLLVAMAMQESRHMDVEERDRSKDGSNSANATIFNLSIDLIQKTGYYWQNYSSFQPISNEQFYHLNTEAGLHDAVRILNKAFDLWGIEDILAFVRRGGDAFDPYSQYMQRDATGSGWRNYWSAMHRAGLKPQSVQDEVVDYLSCIKRFLQYIDSDEGFLTNGCRPDIKCPHLP